MAECLQSEIKIGTRRPIIFLHLRPALPAFHSNSTPRDMETMKVTLYSAHEYLPCSPHVIHLILHFKARVLVKWEQKGLTVDPLKPRGRVDKGGEVESAEAENVGNLLLSTVCVNGSLSRPEFGCFVTVSRVQLHFWSTLRHTSVTPVMHPGHLTQL